jgi:hypothetical protein
MLIHSSDHTHMTNQFTRKSQMTSFRLLFSPIWNKNLSEYIYLYIKLDSISINSSSILPPRSIICIVKSSSPLTISTRTGGYFLASKPCFSTVARREFYFIIQLLIRIT